jgi:hypothetical protein
VNGYKYMNKNHDQKLIKIYSRKTFFHIFRIENCNLLILRPPLRTHKLHEKPSTLKREHPALQNIKNLNFFEFFLYL